MSKPQRNRFDLSDFEKSKNQREKKEKRKTRYIPETIYAHN